MTDNLSHLRCQEGQNFHKLWKRGMEFSTYEVEQGSWTIGVIGGEAQTVSFRLSRPEGWGKVCGNGEIAPVPVPDGYDEEGAIEWWCNQVQCLIFHEDVELDEWNRQIAEAERLIPGGSKNYGLGRSLKLNFR